MSRIFSVFALLALLGGGFAFVGWPHASAAARNEDRLMHAYALVKPGMPAAQLGALGFDTAKAERLSKLALMERFMPKDSKAFDALDPAVRHCYLGSGDCTAYIFDGYAGQMVLLVEDGRVAWKDMFEAAVAENSRVTGERVADAE